MSQTGRLLVVTPLIGDPNFERTVIFLLAHDDDGAFGVVLNRPTVTPVVEVAEEWAPQVSAPGVVFVGGPVRSEAVVGIARRGTGDPGHFAPLTGDVGTIDLHQAPEPHRHPWVGLRLFAGSAGWTPGQLEDELVEGAWWAVDAEPGDILTGEPTTLWSRVLRRQRGRMAWFAHHPDNPSAN